MDSTLSRPLRTPRLLLRAAAPEDADATWEYRRLEAVGEWLHEIPSDLEPYRVRFTEPDGLASMIVAEHQGRIVGDFMLRVVDCWAQADTALQDRPREAQVGWVLDPSWWGQGLATEGVRALLEEGFTQLGLHRVTARCFLANEASWRLMERVGMRREQHAVRDSLHRSRGWLDSVIYAILADEYPPTAGGR